MTYTQHRDTQETLTVLDTLDIDTEKPSDEEIAKRFGYEDDYLNGTVSWWQRTKPKVAGSCLTINYLKLVFDSLCENTVVLQR